MRQEAAPTRHFTYRRTVKVISSYGAKTMTRPTKQQGFRPYLFFLLISVLALFTISWVVRAADENMAAEKTVKEKVSDDQAAVGTEQIATDGSDIPDDMKPKKEFVPNKVLATRETPAPPKEPTVAPSEEAADVAPPAPAPAESAEKEIDVHEIVVMKQLSGPRQTVRFFLKACGRSRYDDAVRTMDFSHMPELNKSNRQLYAYRLAAILVRLDNFVVDDIPETFSDNECYLWPDRQYRAISLRRGEDGTWKFSPSTVSDIPSFYQEIKDKKPVFFNNTFLGQLPDFFYKRFAGILVLQWALLGIFFALGILALKITPWGVFWTIRLFTKFGRSQHEYSKRIQSALRPLAYIAMAWTWYAGLLCTSTNPKLLSAAYIILHPLCVVMLTLMLLRVVDIFKLWLQNYLNTAVNRVKSVLVDLSSGVLKFLVICSAVITIIQAFGISAIGILSGMGIGGLAVALAAQQTIANFFGSLTIILDHPFTVGDYIIVGSTEGVVERIGLRSTSIKTFYDSRVVIPNAQLATDVVDNMGRRQSRRFKTTLGLQYNTPAPLFEAFSAGVRRLIELHPDARRDDIRVSVDDFGSSSINIQITCFFMVSDIHDELRARQSLILDIVRLAEKLGVLFAFPSQTSYMIPTESPTYPLASQIKEQTTAVALGKDFAEAIKYENSAS
jgi:MscS family membrane protein